MPRFDKTGPEGKGSRTGRGMGSCNEKENNKNDEHRFGRFASRGPGRRRGNRRRGGNQE